MTEPSATSKDESLVELLRTGDKILSAAAPLTYTDHVMQRAADEIERLRALLKEYRDAEWMVTHDWGGDRQPILDKVDAELTHETGVKP